MKAGLTKDLRTGKGSMLILSAECREFCRTDDQLLNTGVSFPIAFRKASIYGAEGRSSFRSRKPQWIRQLFLLVGSTYLPVPAGFHGMTPPCLESTAGRFGIPRTSATRRERVFATVHAAAVGCDWHGYGSDWPVAFEEPSISDGAIWCARCPSALISRATRETVVLAEWITGSGGLEA